MSNFENIEHFKPVLNTAKELLSAQNKHEIVSMLNNAELSVVQTGYDNWNGGIYYYTIYIDIPVPEFVKFDIPIIEKEVVEVLNTATRYTESDVFSKAIITPRSNSKIDWSLIDCSQQDMLKHVEYLKNTMISVATGGQRIQNAEQQYKQTYNDVKRRLKTLDIDNPNPYNDLWNWYGKWRSDFRSYQERRDYINEMYRPLMDVLSEIEDMRIVDVKVDLSGWERINRSIIEIKRREQQAQNEEQFQAVGMLCREMIITLGQTVYDPTKHPSIDGIEIGKTDARRMLEAYIAIVLAGNESEELRAYAKSTNKLANSLTHKRTATKKEMMLCTSATLALINFVGVLEDKI
jgi:hypothetical protein